MIERQPMSLSQFADLLAIEPERFLGVEVNRLKSTVTLILEGHQSDVRPRASIISVVDIRDGNPQDAWTLYEDGVPICSSGASSGLVSNGPLFVVRGVLSSNARLKVQFIDGSSAVIEPGDDMRAVQTSGTCPPLSDNVKRKPRKKGK